jgi:hypothetical protein
MSIFDKFRTSEPPPEPEPEPDPAPAPKTFTEDEVQALLQKNAEHTAAVLAEAAKADAPPAEPAYSTVPQVTIPDADEAAFNQALEEGDLAKYHQLSRQRLMHKEQVFAAQVASVQEAGAAEIGRVSEQVMETGLPEYAELKPEIEKRLERFPLSVRNNAEARKFVYNAIRGERMTPDKIEEMVEARIQERMRAGNLTPTSDTSPISTRTDGQPGKLSEQMFDDSDRSALREVGKDLNEFVRHVGRGQYEDTEAYASAAADWQRYQMDPEARKSLYPWMKGNK